MRRGDALQRGFTLLELLVVFALLALVVGVAPFAFNKLQEGAEYRSTVRAVWNAMTAARQQARSTGRDTRFVFEPQSRSFGVEGEARHNVPEPLQLRALTAGEEALPGGEFAIRFIASGGASGGSIDVLRPSGDGTRLRVDWFSGRVEQEKVSR